MATIKVISSAMASIPTVMLRVSTTPMLKVRGNGKKGVRRKSPQMLTEQNVLLGRMEEYEDVRKNFYDPYMSRVDRLHQAASDFKSAVLAHGTGLLNLWDQ